MTADEFNKYCAEAMGYTTRAELSYIVVGHAKYHPVNDLNQMAKVFDKLVSEALIKCHDPDAPENLLFSQLSLSIVSDGIAQAMREFIESTKEE